MWQIVAYAGAFTGSVLALMAGVAVLLTYLRSNSTPASDHQAALGERVAEMEVLVRGLPSLWEEERNRAKKHADAAKQAQRDAQKKLDEVAEIIEAVEQVPGLDAPGGGEVEMQRVLPRLGGPAQPGQENRVAAIAHLMR